jgi:hypothetical protein
MVLVSLIGPWSWEEQRQLMVIMGMGLALLAMWMLGAVVGWETAGPTTEWRIYRSMLCMLVGLGGGGAWAIGFLAGMGPVMPSAFLVISGIYAGMLVLAGLEFRDLLGYVRAGVLVAALPDGPGIAGHCCTICARK